MTAREVPSGVENVRVCRVCEEVIAHLIPDQSIPGLPTWKFVPHRNYGGPGRTYRCRTHREPR